MIERQVTGQGMDFLMHDRHEPVAMRFTQTRKCGGRQNFVIQPICGRQNGAVPLSFGANEQIHPLDFRRVSEDFLDKSFGQKSSRTGNQQCLAV